MRRLCYWFSALLLIASLRAHVASTDTGTSPEWLARELVASDVPVGQGTWLRLRGLHSSMVWTEVGAGEAPSRVEGPLYEGLKNAPSVAERRAALQALRERGYRLTAFVRWSNGSWPGGARAGSGQRAPIDLREAYTRLRMLTRTYGDLVDAWEIENEPDISFFVDNPEVFAAYYKAAALGVMAGRFEHPTSNIQHPTSNDGTVGAWPGWRAHVKGRMSIRQWNSRADGEGLVPSRSAVLLAPLAMPPGPYFERLMVNDVLNYTDGFNYHYYGYADDFSGVYKQFENAVTKWEWAPVAGKGRTAGLGGVKSRELPVFLTEYGYGLLTAEAAVTVEGRVRQWEWFSDVAGQVRDLRIKAPMAFLQTPYEERKINEFGLTMRAVTDGETGTGSVFTAGGVKFSPADFGADRVEPWMQRIGAKVGPHEASPALAYLWDQAEQRPYKSRSWKVEVAEVSSPVVIDFLPTQNLLQAKAWRGYFVVGADEEQTVEPLDSTTAPTRSGVGELVLYNLSERAMRGRLGWPEAMKPTVAMSDVITLAPMERREIPVIVTVVADGVREQVAAVRFVPEEESLVSARWCASFYPWANGMTKQVIDRFDASLDEGAAAREALLARPHAKEEPRLRRDGRWLVTEGVTVEESPDGWRFHVAHYPDKPLRPAIAELPLPPDFAFERGAMLWLQYRIEPAQASGEAITEDAAETTTESAEGDRFHTRTGQLPSMLDLGFRTANGNLFAVWPRLIPTEDWTTYVQNAENFSMAFFGRAEAPWRFSENRPTALFFHFRPSELPAVFEVKAPEIVRWRHSGEEK